MNDMITAAAMPGDPHALIVDLGAYEGPLDLLLEMAREQKVDLAQISILALADQYLRFIAEARALRLELAADYLVMAAWLAFLKSRLLLPPPPAADEPAPQDMAALLQFQLRRLEAMRHAAQQLLGRPQLGREIFARGMPEPIARTGRVAWQASLKDLVLGIAAPARRRKAPAMAIASPALFSVEEAVSRMRRLLPGMPEWVPITAFVPFLLEAGLLGKSALASTFVASLELAKAGELQVRQDKTYGELQVRRFTEDAAHE